MQKGLCCSKFCNAPRSCLRKHSRTLSKARADSGVSSISKTAPLSSSYLDTILGLSAGLSHGSSAVKLTRNKRRWCAVRPSPPLRPCAPVRRLCGPCDASIPAPTARRRSFSKEKSLRRIDRTPASKATASPSHASPISFTSSASPPELLNAAASRRAISSSSSSTSSLSAASSLGAALLLQLATLLAWVEGFFLLRLRALEGCTFGATITGA
mmetsp:Transcript_71821/g.113782  ORF Transcript_71821/g.113782 Transcript_71821/m.113782 type:complete len:213 (-) Transcript_71821:41-679(-)